MKTADFNEAKKSPLALAQFCTKGKYMAPDHILYMNNIIMNLAERKIKRVMINMPPRHGKSEFISKYFPFWYLGTYPEHRIILTSYQAKFAESFGRRILDLVKEHGEALFDIQINPNEKSARSFGLLNHEGGLNAVGAGGALTGRGADLLIIDDPVKNDRDAASVRMRDNLWEWYKATAFSRLEPEGVVVVLMTRWHYDDLCSRILSLDEDFDEDDDEKWELVRFPAIAEESDVLGRKPGDALWEARFPLRRLDRIKRTLGEYWFSALYQQSPNPAGGGIFKSINFRYFTADGDNYYLHFSNAEECGVKPVHISDCRVYACADLAVSSKESSDYTAIVIFAETPAKDILILDVIRERFDGAAHLKLIKNIYNLYNPYVIGIESTQYQAVLVQQAQNEGLPVCPLKPDSNKLTRALPITSFVENGKVYFRKHAPWLNAFEEELKMFPNGRHDDMVDAFAYIINLIKPHTTSMPVGIKGKRLDLSAF